MALSFIQGELQPEIAGHRFLAFQNCHSPHTMMLPWRNALCLVSSWEGVSFLSRCSRISRSTNECLSFLVYNGHSLCLVTVKKSINVFNKLPSTRVWVNWGWGGCSSQKPESCFVHERLPSDRPSSPPGHSQSQWLMPCWESTYRLSCWKGRLDVCMVIKLKITFVSPFCHSPQKEGKHRHVGKLHAHVENFSQVTTYIDDEKKNQTAR